MIEIENISVKAGKFEFSNISLNIEKGKFHVLLGPTGSGKTLLLKTIAGLQHPQGGHIRIRGQEVTHLPPEKRHLSYLPQDHSLFPHLTVFENIAFGLSLDKKKYPPAAIKTKVAEAAAMLGISHLLDRNIQHLSGGESQRVALARALVLDNEILLLDEPTASLHEAMEESFFLLIEDIARRYNLTVLLATHHRDSAFMLADQLHFVWEGRLLLSTAPQAIFRMPLPKTVADYLGFSNFLLLTKTDTEAGDSVFYCEQLNTAFEFPSLLSYPAGKIMVAIRPIDVRMVKDDDARKKPANAFQMLVKSALFKLNDAIVLLQHPQTGFSLKMEISIYNLKKFGIEQGKMILCKFKDASIIQVEINTFFQSHQKPVSRPYDGHES